MDAPVKIMGYSLNGVKLTLKPVNNEATDSAFSPMNTSQ